MKLVLTGGPSGGKTTLAGALQKEFPQQLVIVPEAASLIFSGGFPRRPGLKTVEFRQRAIYYVQRELEGLIESENRSSLLVCDRGSMDGVAYWPNENPSFLESLGTTPEREYQRYDWVIHLDTAPASFYDQTNPLRTESYDEAWRLNERVKSAWAAHQQRFVITNQGHFVDKLHRALFVVEQILTGHRFSEIESHLMHLQSSAASS